MARFLTIGTDDQLKVKVPAEGTTGWAQGFLEDFIRKLVEHDHTGNGKGVKIKLSSLEPNSISGSVFRLLNDEWLRSAKPDGTDQNILRVNADDELEIAPTVVELDVKRVVGKNEATLEAPGSVILVGHIDGAAIKIDYKLIEVDSDSHEVVGTVTFCGTAVEHTYCGEDIVDGFTDTSGVGLKTIPTGIGLNSTTYKIVYTVTIL